MVTIEVTACNTCPFNMVDEYLNFECCHPLTAGDRTIVDRSAILPNCALKKELIRVKLIKL